jgi:hypothetical protein
MRTDQLREPCRVTLWYAIRMSGSLDSVSGLREVMETMSETVNCYFREGKCVRGERRGCGAVGRGIVGYQP